MILNLKKKLLVLSSLSDNWSGTVTAVSSSVGGAKMTFDGMHDLILGEDVHRQSAGEASNSLVTIEDRGRGSNRGCGGSGRSKSRMRGGQNNRRDVTCLNCKESDHVKSHCPMLMEDKGQKDMNMEGDFEGDTLIFYS